MQRSPVSKIEYCINFILRRISFGATDSGNGATPVQITITFQNKTLTKDFQEPKEIGQSHISLVWCCSSGEKQLLSVRSVLKIGFDNICFIKNAFLASLLK
jgi:hypothetical protein